MRRMKELGKELGKELKGQQRGEGRWKQTSDKRGPSVYLPNSFLLFKYAEVTPLDDSDQYFLSKISTFMSFCALNAVGQTEKSR